VGVTGDAAEALGERLRIAMVAARRDLRAAAHGVPRRVGPLDFGVLAHVLGSYLGLAFGLDEWTLVYYNHLLLFARSFFVRIVFTQAQVPASPTRSPGRNGPPTFPTQPPRKSR